MQLAGLSSLHTSVMCGMKRASTQARTASRAAVSSGWSRLSQANMSCSRSCCCASLENRPPDLRPSDLSGSCDWNTSMCQQQTLPSYTQDVSSSSTQRIVTCQPAFLERASCQVSATPGLHTFSPNDASRPYSCTHFNESAHFTALDVVAKQWWPRRKLTRAWSLASIWLTDR